MVGLKSGRQWVDCASGSCLMVPCGSEDVNGGSVGPGEGKE